MPEPSDSRLTSVIMVTHYDGQALEPTVDSLLAQTSPIEIILVNNGSTKAAEAWFAEIAKSDPRLRVVRGQGNIGLAAGNNLGAKAARGNALLFVRPGVLLAPNAVELLCDKRAQKLTPCAIGARLLDRRGAECPSGRRRILTPLVAIAEGLLLTSFFPSLRLSLAEEPVPEDLVEVPAVTGSCLFVSAKDFTSLRGFNEKYCADIDDMDFCLRLQRAEGKVFYAPDIVAEKQSDGKGTFDMDGQKSRIRSFIHYFHENFGHAYPQPVLWALDALLWGRLSKPWVLSQLGNLGLKGTVK